MNQATDYVVMKLISGEQILAAVMAEFDESVVVAFPLVLKSVPAMKNGMIYEKIATAEFCAFTDDKEFNIHRKDIIFMKPMKKNVALMYQRSLEEMYIMSDQSTLRLDDFPEEQQAQQTEEVEESSVDPELLKKLH